MRLAVLLVGAVLLLGCGEEAEPRLVTFGHSFVDGRYEGAIAPWPGAVAAATDRTLVNRGVSGSESPAVKDAVESYEPQEGDVVVIEAALNDVRRLGDAGAGRYARELDEMLEHLDSTGPPDEVIVLSDPPITGWRAYPPYDQGSTEELAAYREQTERVAVEHGATVVDLATGWVPRADVTADRVHPDESGVEHIAAAVEAAIEP